MSGILTLLVGALGGGVPTANLTAYLDVNNPSSFPGIGNTWYNMAPNGRSGTDFVYQNGSGTRSSYVYDTTSGGAFILNTAGIFPKTAGALFNDNTGNFTLEIWARWGAVGVNTANVVPPRLALIGETFGNPDQIGYELTFVRPGDVVGNSLYFGSYNGVYNYTANTATQYRPYPGQWYHIVGVQQQINSTTWRDTLYINGTAVGTADIGNWDDSNLGWKINQALSNDSTANTGNIAVSIVRTYNTAFSPSEVIYNYNQDSSRFVGGSHQYNGANAFLSVPAGTAWDFGTNNYTVEWFGNDTSSDTGNAKYVFSVGNGNPGFYATVQNTGPNTGTFRLFANGSAVLNTAISGYQNSWTNYAISKNGTNTNLYINGTLVSSNTADNTTINNTTSNLRIGTDSAGTSGSFYSGQITNFRVTKGQALYTGDFSPVPMPFNSDSLSNVQLSLLATDSVTTLVDSSPRATPLVVTSANVAWSNSTPFTQRSGTVERFGYTGGIQTWTAPLDVTSVDVAVIGAAGGYGSLDTSATPGGGAVIVGNLTVTPGQTYYLMVGGQSLNRIPAYGNGGYGGAGNVGNGGAGGGMSGIFSTATTDQANSIIIAAGGGGTGARAKMTGGNAGGSNTAFAFYGSTGSARQIGQRGEQESETFYGNNGGGGGVTNLGIANATVNLGNGTITFTYSNPVASESPIYSDGSITSRRATISSGSSNGLAYTLNYQGTGNTANIAYLPGQLIQVTGANNANFNGNWIVTSSAANAVTFTGTVANGGSANAIGNVFSQNAPMLINVSGANNSNYNGMWNVFPSGFSPSQCLVYNLSNTNPGPWTSGGNPVINAPGKQGNVYDLCTGFPDPGFAMRGGNGSTPVVATREGGGGGGGGYWGGGGGAGGGGAAGGGGGGSSYIDSTLVSNVYYRETNDFVGNLTVNSGNGLIMISY